VIVVVRAARLVALVLVLAGSCDSARPAPGGDTSRARGRRNGLEAAGGARPVEPLASIDLDDGSPETSITRIWSSDLSHPARALHVTPDGDIAVIGPDRLTVLDPRGRQRWYRNLAPGDRVLPSGPCLYVQTADHRNLLALDDLGGTRWERELAGDLSPVGSGLMLMIDAAAVRAIECRRGRERWMFSPDRQRRMRLLGSDDHGLSLLGEIGERRVLFSLDLEGQVRTTLELPRATQDAMIVGSGWILVRTATSLVALDEAGRSLWTRAVTPRTEVAFHRNNVILADGFQDGHIEIDAIDRTGTIVREESFDAGGEPVTLQVLGSDEMPLLIAACTGALRTCSNTDLSIAPFNRLWACAPGGRVIAIVDRGADLSFDVGQEDAAILIVASTSSGSGTSVIRLGADLRRTSSTDLNGRRMLGPIKGEGSSWLVATCHGPRCDQPWQLFGVEYRQER
jgi:hypothetical protein